MRVSRTVANTRDLMWLYQWLVYINRMLDGNMAPKRKKQVIDDDWWIKAPCQSDGIYEYMKKQLKRPPTPWRGAFPCAGIGNAYAACEKLYVEKDVNPVGEPDKRNFMGMHMHDTDGDLKGIYTCSVISEIGNIEMKVITNISTKFVLNDTHRVTQIYVRSSVQHICSSYYTTC